MDEFLTCPICFYWFDSVISGDRTPLMLDCGHTLCKKCVEKSPRCFTCGIFTTKKRPNIVLQHIVDYWSEVSSFYRSRARTLNYDHRTPLRRSGPNPHLPHPPPPLLLGPKNGPEKKIRRRGRPTGKGRRLPHRTTRSNIAPTWDPKKKKKKTTTNRNWMGSERTK